MVQVSSKLSSEGELDSKPNRKVRKDKRSKYDNWAKIVVRHLPPTMTAEEFLKNVHPLSDHNYFRFDRGDSSLGPLCVNRAYINFTAFEDAVTFRDRFDGYVFLDSKGNEFPALVQLAPYPMVPKTSKINVDNRKDQMIGSVLTDESYLKFCEKLTHEKNHPLGPVEVNIENNKDLDKKITPLIEFLRDRKSSRRDERDKKKEVTFGRKKQKEELKVEEKDRMKELKLRLKREKKEKKLFAKIEARKLQAKSVVTQLPPDPKSFPELGATIPVKKHDKIHDMTFVPSNRKNYDYKKKEPKGRDDRNHKPSSSPLTSNSNTPAAASTSGTSPSAGNQHKSYKNQREKKMKQPVDVKAKVTPQSRPSQVLYQPPSTRNPPQTGRNVPEMIKKGRTLPHLKGGVSSEVEYVPPFSPGTGMGKKKN